VIFLSEAEVRELLDLDELVEGALGDYFISVAPAPWSAAEVRAASEQGLALGASR